jgi:hypothetical protein
LNIGAENKKQVRLMIALLIIAALVLIYSFRNFGTSSAAPPSASSAATTAQRKTPPVVDSTLDPRLRVDILAASQSKKYEPGRNIFRMEEAPIPSVAGSVRTGAAPKIWTVEAPPTPTPTPPPPPINLKFYGFASKGNEPKRIFLSDQDEVFLARQGDIVERKYKVTQINNTSVVIEDVLNNNRQTIPLTPQQR